MQIQYHNVHETRNFVTPVSGSRLTIGRAADCDIVLNSPFVSEQAAELRQTSDGWLLQVTNENSVTVAGRPCAYGTSVSVPPEGEFSIFPFEFQLSDETTDGDPRSAAERLLEERSLLFLRKIHVALLDKMNFAEAETEQQPNDEAVLRLERNLEILADSEGLLASENGDLLQHFAGQCVIGELIDETLRFADDAEENTFLPTAGWSRLHSQNQTQERELRRLMRHISGRLQLAPPDELQTRMATLEQRFASEWQAFGDQIAEETRVYLALRQLKKQIKDIVFGYGPLEDLLRLPTVTEIMVVGSDRIFVERDGRIENSGRRFVSDAVTLAIIERIVARVGRRLDKSQPVADARLSDGSRVNAVAAPIALDGPLLTVRKFPNERITAQDLVDRFGSLSRRAAEFLEACVLGRCNILISGGTGTGKTTVLNCLADYIQDGERIITIEDTAELRIAKRHVARMETKSANVEGNGEYDIAALVRNALRMRPDRVVVGECRGREALWMLQAMNTGHDGSMTTIHANSARDVVMRLEVMVQTAADLPVHSIHRQISSAVDVVVQLERLRCGRRVVAEIAEVLPPHPRREGVEMRTLFERSDDGELAPTGRMPTFLPALVHRECLTADALYR